MHNDSFVTAKHSSFLSGRTMTVTATNSKGHIPLATVEFSLKQTAFQNENICFYRFFPFIGFGMSTSNFVTMSRGMLIKVTLKL